LAGTELTQLFIEDRLVITLAAVPELAVGPATVWLAAFVTVLAGAVSAELIVLEEPDEVVSLVIAPFTTIWISVYGLVVTA
jgi:hypothetical protein